MTHRFCRPFFSLQDDDYTKIREIFESGWVSIGGNVARLEQEFSRICDVEHAIACSSATVGLLVAVKAAGWRNMRIALPAFTWPSTVFAIESNSGNAPVFCDIDEQTWLVDPSGSYDALVMVDTFGNACPPPLTCSSVDTPTIYDAAHGFGLSQLGHRGLAEVVSFSFTKPVTAMEGGMILTRDGDFARVARELCRLVGRMEEINALVALRSMEGRQERARQEAVIIGRYRDGLTCAYTEQKIPYETNNSVYSILFESSRVRNAAMAALTKLGVETKIYYEPLVEGLSSTDFVYSRILSLPTYPSIATVQPEIIRTINEAAEYRTPGLSYFRESGYMKTYLRR